MRAFDGQRSDNKPVRRDQARLKADIARLEEELARLPARAMPTLREGMRARLAEMKAELAARMQGSGPRSSDVPGPGPRSATGDVPTYPRRRMAATPPPEEG